MKKLLLFALITLSTLFSACLFEDDEEEWDAAKVCPETGMNAYGMPNRGTFVDERDGRVYKYTTIGDQVWMAENLKYELPYPYSLCYGMETCRLRGHSLNDTVHVCSRDTTHLAEIAQRMQSTCTDNDCIATEWCEKVGRYYTLMDGDVFDMSLVDTICPSGWHVPSKEEWETLFDAMGDKESFWRLASTDSLLTHDYFYSSTSLKNTEMRLGSDDCGYNAIPDKMLFVEWSSTLRGLMDPYVAYLGSEDAYVVRILSAGYNKTYVESWRPIRCLKD